MLWLVANRWPIRMCTNHGTCKRKREDVNVSIAIFSELAWFLNNKPLFVKACHQYHEVVMTAGINVAAESQGMSWLCRQDLELVFMLFF